MKKLIILAVMLAACTTAAMAQKHMVISTEKIFKALPDYAQAIDSIDKLAKQYQSVIDTNYANIEKQYNNYQAQKQYLTESARRSQEDAILAREAEVEKYQEEKFGQEGEIIKKRVELIKPIQDKVFSVIGKYAQDNGYTLVIDLSSNPSVIYYSPSVDKTDDIIKLVK